MGRVRTIGLEIRIQGGPGGGAKGEEGSGYNFFPKWGGMFVGGGGAKGDKQLSPGS